MFAEQAGILSSYAYLKLWRLSQDILRSPYQKRNLIPNGISFNRIIILHFSMFCVVCKLAIRSFVDSKDALHPKTSHSSKLSRRNSDPYYSFHACH